jgi:hypothetical protein
MPTAQLSIATGVQARRIAYWPNALRQTKVAGSMSARTPRAGLAAGRANARRSATCAKHGVGRAQRPVLPFSASGAWR